MSMPLAKDTSAALFYPSQLGVGLNSERENFFALGLAERHRPEEVYTKQPVQEEDEVENFLLLSRKLNETLIPSKPAVDSESIKVPIYSRTTVIDRYSVFTALEEDVCKLGVMSKFFTGMKIIFVSVPWCAIYKKSFTEFIKNLERLSEDENELANFPVGKKLEKSTERKTETREKTSSTKARIKGERKRKTRRKKKNRTKKKRGGNRRRKRNKTKSRKDETIERHRRKKENELQGSNELMHDNLLLEQKQFIRESAGGQGTNNISTKGNIQNVDTQAAARSQFYPGNSGNGVKKGCCGGDGGDNNDKKEKIIPGHYLDKPVMEDVDMKSQNTSQPEDVKMQLKSKSDPKNDVDMQSKSKSDPNNVEMNSIPVSRVDIIEDSNVKSSSDSRNAISQGANAAEHMIRQPSEVKKRPVPKVPTQVEMLPSIPGPSHIHSCIVRQLLLQRLSKLAETDIQKCFHLQRKTLVIHAVHCEDQNCRQGRVCSLVKVILGHFDNHGSQLEACHPCQFAKALLFLHTINCNLGRSCEVPCCQQNRTLICTAVTKQQDKRRLTPGHVLFSQTPAFKKGEIVSEGVDYCFLYRKHIGGGQYGQVYRTWFYDLRGSYQGDIALKQVLYKSSYHEQRFCEEAKIVEHLGDDHPNILKTFAMVNVQNLRHGLVFSERCAMNILVTSDMQRIKIADFDTVIMLLDELTKQGLRRVGTPGYCAPEVLKSLPHGRPADVFGLGVVLLELLFGNQYDLTEENRKEQIKEVAENDRPLADLIIRCLDVDPKERPTSKQIEYNQEILKYLSSDYKPEYDRNMVCRDIMKAYPPEKLGFDDLEGNDKVLDKMWEIRGLSNGSIEQIVDQLPKELKSIKEPQTSFWVGHVQVDEARGNDDAATSAAERNDRH